MFTVLVYQSGMGGELELVRRELSTEFFDTLTLKLAQLSEGRSQYATPAISSDFSRPGIEFFAQVANTHRELRNNKVPDRKTVERTAWHPGKFVE